MCEKKIDSTTLNRYERRAKSAARAVANFGERIPADHATLVTEARGLASRLGGSARNVRSLVWMVREGLAFRKDGLADVVEALAEFDAPSEEDGHVLPPAGRLRALIKSMKDSAHAAAGEYVVARAHANQRIAELSTDMRRLRDRFDSFLGELNACLSDEIEKKGDIDSDSFARLVALVQGCRDELGGRPPISPEKAEELSEMGKRASAAGGALREGWASSGECVDAGAADVRTFPPLPPGRYRITDPCYVIPRGEDYDAVCRATFGETPGGGEFRDANMLTLSDGTRLFACSTAWGDGFYPVLDRAGKVVGECPVDSGQLCAIPEEYVQGENAREGSCPSGVVVDIEAGAVLEYAGGDVRVGGYRVITSGEDE